MKENRGLKEQLSEAYQRIRQQTTQLCQPLLIEDYVIQSMDDVSPPKWHLAHTTWFFETFILMLQKKNYQPFDPSFQHLFNSYYQTLGHPYPRIQRGLLSRPTVETVYEYRKQVDEHMLDYINHSSDDSFRISASTLILGLHHEQQHQELLLMDIKHNFSLDPNFPVYQLTSPPLHDTVATSMKWIEVEGGIVELGHQGKAFCFDNELPAHQVILKPYVLANRLVTNEEYLEFINANGYNTPSYWLSDGWDYIQKHRWQAPLYWLNRENKWYHYTLSGLRVLNPTEPAVHVSYYEADAFARFLGLRLPREEEWEHFVSCDQYSTQDGNFLEENIFHPCQPNLANQKLAYQLFGDVWEWTASSYSPYPGYKPLEGALGEYNGKFMSNQFVLRGGSCVTPRSHIRASYRNFFQPEKRWQFSGIRLAKQ